MSDALGIRFFDDKNTRTGPHDVPIDFKTNTANMTGFTGFPLGRLHDLKAAIRKIANQDTSDLQVEPAEIVENPDGSVLINLGSTLLNGQIDKIYWPSASFIYTKAAALDFCDGIDAHVPAPPAP
jgi:hypothetical protein